MTRTNWVFLLLIYGALVSQLSFGDVCSERRKTSSSNLGQTFVAIANLTGVRNMRSPCIDNNSDAEMAINCSDASPTASSKHNIWVAAGNTFCYDPPGLSGSCYWRCVDASCTTGTISVTTMGDCP